MSTKLRDKDRQEKSPLNNIFIQLMNDLFRNKALIIRLTILTTIFLHNFCLFANPNFQVIYNSGEKKTTLAVKTNSGHDFVSFQDFADCLNARTYYSDQAKKAILYLDSQEIKVTALNPFVIVNNQIFQMPIDTRFLNTEIFVPVKYFVPLLQKYALMDIRLDEINRQILVSLTPQKGRLTSIDVEPKSNGLLVKICGNAKIAQSDITARIRKDWVYLDIYKGRIDSRLLKETDLRGPVKQIVPSQVSPNLAQISLKISQPVLDVKATLSEDARTIILSIRTKDKLSDDILQTLEKDRRKWQIDKIVIDPGHGGKDPGAVGPSGTYEKDVVLSIAKHLKKLLESRLKVEVLLTRNGDQFVRLNERTAMANRVGAKLFISIHANSNVNRKVRGSSTYILGPAKSEEAAEVARKENSVIQLEATRESYPDFNNEQFILSSIAQSEFTRESEVLADILQKTVTEKTSLRNRGVKQAGYYVLIGASMPNILFETAFISNRTEEKKLKSSRFQKKLAEAIFISIKQFKEKYEQMSSVLDY